MINWTTKGLVEESDFEINHKRILKNTAILLSSKINFKKNKIIKKNITNKIFLFFHSKPISMWNIFFY